MDFFEEISSKVEYFKHLKRSVTIGIASHRKPILYLVTETKGSLREAELRPNEWRRIQCGAAHFGSKQLGRKGALEGVDYKVVTKARELP